MAVRAHLPLRVEEDQNAVAELREEQDGVVHLWLHKSEKVISAKNRT
eukprot:SAG31_NODE_25484_length_460_cov_1.024931_1_plen_46_part_10